MSNIIDGKYVASTIKSRVALEIANLKQQGIETCLAVIIVGDDPASQVYVRNKKRACEECGIISKEYVLPANYGQEKLLELINELNLDPSVNGILCQLPLPLGYNEKEVTEAIWPIKDVDCFHPTNVGRIVTSNNDSTKRVYPRNFSCDLP